LTEVVQAIEWLRWLETCDLADPVAWAEDVISALERMGDLPEVVLACKRIVARNLHVGLVWRLASEVLLRYGEPESLEELTRLLAGSLAWEAAVADLDPFELVGVVCRSLYGQEVTSIRRDLYVRFLGGEGGQGLKGCKILLVGAYMVGEEAVVLFPEEAAVVRNALEEGIRLRLVVEPLGCVPPSVIRESTNRLGSSTDPLAPGSMPRRYRTKVASLQTAYFLDAAVSGHVVPTTALRPYCGWQPAPELFL
jgi:hypothetical protein